MNLFTDLGKELTVTRKEGQGERLGVWALHVYAAIFKISAVTTVEGKELCSIFCNNLNRKKSLKTDTHICMTESLCCMPETNTALLINYAPI